MSDSATRCICQWADARDCMRARNGADLRFLICGDDEYGPVPSYEDEECSCGCHVECDLCSECGEPLAAFAQCGSCDWMENDDA